jgi:hypothetical protein
MSEDQARDKDGKFAAGGHTAEQATRQAGRYPVKVHVDKSVASHTGKSFVGNLGKALIGVAAGAAGTFIHSALRSQGHGRR